MARDSAEGMSSRCPSFTGCGACRLTSSSRSTSSRPRPAPPAPTSSISAWAIPICPRRSMSSTSSSRPSASRAPTAIPPRRAFPGLRRAQAGYYARRFGVKLNPETQVVATLGSKEGFANMAQAITAPGDVVLVPNPVLSDPRLRLPDGGRRDPLGAGRADAGILPRARARDPAFDPEADRGGRLLSLQPDGDGRLARFLQGSRDLRQEARDFRAFGSRLRRGLFRRRAAAVGAAGAGRVRRRGRVHLDVEDVLDGGLAHRLRGRQRAAAGRAGAGEILSRLWRLYADPGRGGRRAQRPRGLHPARCARPTSAAAT